MGGALTSHASAVRRAGRYGDTKLVHMSPEELAVLRSSWGEPTINPDTGLPEYFSLGGFFKSVLPIALSVFAPGIGTALGSALGVSEALAPIVGNALLGGGIGALSGGNFKSALMGGGLGALSAGLAPMVKNSLVGTSVGDFFGLTPQSTIFDQMGGTDIPVSMAVDTPDPGYVGAEQAPAAIEAGTSTPMTAVAASAPNESFFSKYKVPLAVGAGALMLGGMGQKSQELQRSGPPPGFNAPLPEVTFNRSLDAPDEPGRYYTFGATPFNFFRDNFVRTGDEGMARGRYVQGPGGGRDDVIPARLSNDEYVMDAETVALLGDGSADEGARKLDELRKRLRQHKGRAMAKGKFSPDARPPASYMGRA